MNNKMKLKLSTNHNINYIATVVQIKNILPIEGADNIVQVIVDGFSVIVDKSTKIGDIFIFCPIDSQLNPELLEYNNLYEDYLLNKNYLENNQLAPEEYKTGFFTKKGRVRPITLRKTPSQGFLISPGMFNFIEGIDIDFEKEIGTRFDSIDDKLIIKKYEIINQEDLDDLKYPNKGIEKEALKDFNFHYNTAMFNRNLNQINLNDTVTITTKIHGTSAIFSKRKYKPISIIDKIKKFFKLFKDTVYIKASRTRIRKGKDIWNNVGEIIKPYLPDNITIYGEIAGYNQTSIIQKDYDYGCECYESIFMPYRVVRHLDNGYTEELSMMEVIAFSKELASKVYNKNLKILIPELLYRGQVSGLLSDLKYNQDNWRDLLLSTLINKKEWNMEKNEPLCKNKVPREGIVIRLDGYSDRAVFKLKCQKFYEKESRDLE